MGVYRTVKRLAFYIKANTKIGTDAAFLMAEEAAKLVDMDGISDRKRYVFAKDYLRKSTGIGNIKPNGRSN